MSEPVVASGEKAKARDLLEAVRVLKLIENEKREATPEERVALALFPGFGCLALAIFPNPVTRKWRDQSWERLGKELQSRLTEEEYDSSRRTVFNAFYTSPTVIRTIYSALSQLGIPEDALVLEPGCGPGAFIAHSPEPMRFIGIELDSLSGRIAKARFKGKAEIRVQNFRDAVLPAGSVDAVVGNVPFADVTYSFAGQKLALHDYFFAKSVNALKPGGIAALVTTHYTLDKRTEAFRRYLSESADFLGAIRLPSDAFKREGTSVVADIVFLRKRSHGTKAQHAEDRWLASSPLDLEGEPIWISGYFHANPDNVLGDYSRKDTLYGGSDSYSVLGSGNLDRRLDEAVSRIVRMAGVPSAEPVAVSAAPPETIGTPAETPTDEAAHITEGSLYVGPDGVIRQVSCGEGLPVCHGTRELHAHGTEMGRRLAALITLRDLARRVLRSQNEGWTKLARADARDALNAAYLAFILKYGPINLTTHSTTTDGTSVRRMPNLTKFREDPDAMLVMSLEEYDEVTGEATKAPIMYRDVVGMSPAIETVSTAEEGLLVSLDRRGYVDLGLIGKLLGKPERDVLEDLGDLVYLDPATRDWQTADVYLSGNVREKLAIARSAGPEFGRNFDALLAVQPEDVLPGDIDANLGAPWIPVEDVRQFASHLFSCLPEQVVVARLAKDAVWTVEVGWEVSRSVAVQADYGSRRADAVNLLEMALNLRIPTIFDESIDSFGRTVRVINIEETVAAKEKQRRIKDQFKRWIFADPDRANRLVRIYNDTYNNIRPRLFDGAHLRFPGMNDAIHLHPHQLAAIWRGMTSGNTLLAHVVGAGKTFVMAATGIKMRQAGLIKKPMFVVPNHMLEQFSREFMQLYPNAKLLAASKDDFTRERRKRLTAKIATGEWDGVIVTHSSFERIGMSRDYQERFLRDQIEEYENLLLSASKDTPRNIIKTLEKQKVRREEKLHELIAEDKKDDGLVFDELGVDHLFIDEAHYFKNLETPTKMERVAGIQTSGSERAFDILMKARYLDGLHSGHGLTFATGTPISNTMVEMYTVSRFLDVAGLTSREVDHFDAWAATFGEVVESMEVSPDGSSLRAKARFAKFINLPELQQMFRRFADVQTADMLNLPRPKLQTGKAIIVACPMSLDQARIQQSLVQRYERIRREKVDPKEDNALAITTDGRKLALDARMLSAEAPDFPESKINALTANVHAIWERSTPNRGTQLIFLDMGVKATEWGFCAYEEVRAKLIERGIPPTQVAFMGEADSDDKKRVLFDKVRSGSIRVLIGSTQKMGTGTNVQKRLLALHHLDAPWKPAEVEQREGRILRQGNDNPEVAIYRYVTEGSFDAFMWQALETKARFISQVMTGSNTLRTADDIGGQELSYAEVKAIASGNPEVLVLAETDAELQRLAIIRKNHADEQYMARLSITSLPETIQKHEESIANFTADRETAASFAETIVTINEVDYVGSEAVPSLRRILDRMPVGVDTRTNFPVGEYRGLHFGLTIMRHSSPELYLGKAVTLRVQLTHQSHGPVAILNALDRMVGSYEWRISTEERDRDAAKAKLRDYEKRIGNEFPFEAYADELASLRERLKTALSSTSNPAAEPPYVVAEEIHALRDRQSASATDLDRPLEPRRIRAAESVAAMIRGRQVGIETLPPEPMPEPVQAEPQPEALEVTAAPAEANPPSPVEPVPVVLASVDVPSTEPAPVPDPDTPQVIATRLPVYRRYHRGERKPGKCEAQPLMFGL